MTLLTGVKHTYINFFCTFEDAKSPKWLHLYDDDTDLKKKEKTPHNS